MLLCHYAIMLLYIMYEIYLAYFTLCNVYSRNLQYTHQAHYFHDTSLATCFIQSSKPLPLYFKLIRFL